MVYGIISAKDNQTSLAYFKSKKVSQLEPENLKGRGLIKVDGEVMEFQTAIATDRCDDMERIELLRNMCASMAEGATEVAESIPENLRGRYSRGVMMLHRCVMDICCR